MKISDVLRSLADAVAEKETHDSIGNQAPEQTDTGDNQTDQTGVFVSPLQQKMELLKKSVGVENIYDNPEEAGDKDELEAIKKLSGIASVIQHETSDSSDPT